MSNVNNRSTGFSTSVRPQAQGIAISGGPGKFQQNIKLRNLAATHLSTNASSAVERDQHAIPVFQPSLPKQQTLTNHVTPTFGKQTLSTGSTSVNRLFRPKASSTNENINTTATTSASMTKPNVDVDQDLLRQDFLTLLGAAGLGGSREDMMNIQQRSASTSQVVGSTQQPSQSSQQSILSSQKIGSTQQVVSASQQGGSTQQVVPVSQQQIIPQRPKFQSLADKSILETKLDVVVKHVERVINNQDRVTNDYKSLQESFKTLTSDVLHLKSTCADVDQLKAKVADSNQSKFNSDEFQTLKREMTESVSNLTQQLQTLNSSRVSDTPNAVVSTNDVQTSRLLQTLNEESRAQLADIKSLFQQVHAINANVVENTNKVSNLAMSVQPVLAAVSQRQHSPKKIRGTCFHDRVPIFETVEDLLTVAEGKALHADSKACLGYISAMDTVSLVVPVSTMRLTVRSTDALNNVSSNDSNASLSSSSNNVVGYSFVEWVDSASGNLISGYTLVYGPRINGVSYLTTNVSSLTTSLVPHIGDFTV